MSEPALAEVPKPEGDYKDLYDIGDIPPLGHVPKNMHAWTIRQDRHGAPEEAMQLEVVPTWELDSHDVLVLVMAAWCAPIALIGAPTLEARLVAAAGLVAMIASYAPTLRYYGRSQLWGLAMPIIATLYLAMTWSSALRYWRGARSEWKGRVYARGSHG